MIIDHSRKEDGVACYIKSPYFLIFSQDFVAKLKPIYIYLLA